MVLRRRRQSLALRHVPLIGMGCLRFHHDNLLFCAWSVAHYVGDFIIFPLKVCIVGYFGGLASGGLSCGLLGTGHVVVVVVCGARRSCWVGLVSLPPCPYYRPPHQFGWREKLFASHPHRAPIALPLIDVLLCSVVVKRPDNRHGRDNY